MAHNVTIKPEILTFLYSFFVILAVKDQLFITGKKWFRNECSLVQNSERQVYRSTRFWI